MKVLILPQNKCTRTYYSQTIYCVSKTQWCIVLIINRQNDLIKAELKPEASLVTNKMVKMKKLLKMKRGK